MPHCANYGPAHMKVALVSSLVNPRVFSIMGGLALLTQILSSIKFLSNSRTNIHALTQRPSTTFHASTYNLNLMMHLGARQAC